MPLRLALLRQWHMDPVDLAAYQVAAADTSVPEFDDWEANQTVSEQWAGLRADAGRDLMRALLAAAQAGAGRRLPLLVKQRGMNWTDDWYGAWADAGATLPAMTQAAFYVDDYNLNGYAAFAHTQCRVDLYALPLSASQNAEMLSLQLQQVKPGWDGVVLDVSAAPSGDPLAALVK